MQTGGTNSCEKSPLPTPIVVLVVGNHGAVVGWPAVVPGDVPLVGVPLHKSRKTLDLIREAKTYTLNLVTNGERAMEIFGQPGEDKLAKWGNVTNCRLLPCKALGDASRVVECIYDREVELGDHLLVFCRAVASYGCGDFAMWDPCRRRLEV